LDSGGKTEFYRQKNVAVLNPSCYNQSYMENPKIFYQKLSELVNQAPVAVATIIQVHGSVPREVGTKMIIHPLGQHYGTVGGGCGEAEVIRAGLDVIETGQPKIVAVDLTEDISMQTLGVCGGIMDVYVERWQS
jgi:xanthine dehydrogenase accessory factor